jgi:hypothetical protein
MPLVPPLVALVDQRERSILTTTIHRATSKGTFHPQTKTMTFNRQADRTLAIVDGQHREQVNEIRETTYIPCPGPLRHSHVMGY